MLFASFFISRIISINDRGIFFLALSLSLLTDEIVLLVALLLIASAKNKKKKTCQRAYKPEAR
jgi:hypothetical protein